MKRITLATVFAITAFAVAQAQSPTVEGQVNKIDEAQGKITLKHGPIKNLDMDAMTMVFRVQDPAVLKTVKTGDKVKFEADRVNGQLTVTKIEKAK
jgi:Cu(I)/Ag(I) efflux system periplasmic protein CusF